MGERPVLDYGRPEPKRRPLRTSWLLKVLGMILAAYVLIGIAVLIVDQLAMRQIHDRSGQVHCASNLRQIGQAIQLYTPDNQGLFPPDLQTIARTQQIGLECFVCPSSKDSRANDIKELNTPSRCSYVYVDSGFSVHSRPDCIVTLEDPANHNLEGGNVLFADYHVEFLDFPTIQHILNELNAGRNPPSTLTPTLSQAAAEKDYQTNWKPRMPQLKSGVWHIPTTQGSATPK